LARDDEQDANDQSSITIKDRPTSHASNRMPLPVEGGSSGSGQSFTAFRFGNCRGQICPSSWDRCQRADAHIPSLGEASHGSTLAGTTHSQRRHCRDRGANHSRDRLAGLAPHLQRAQPRNWRNRFGQTIALLGVWLSWLLHDNGAHHFCGRCGNRLPLSCHCGLRRVSAPKWSPSALQLLLGLITS